jgi:hypothetical protein
LDLQQQQQQQPKLASLHFNITALVLHDTANIKTYFNDNIIITRENITVILW